MVSKYFLNWFYFYSSLLNLYFLSIFYTSTYKYFITHMEFTIFSAEIHSYFSFTPALVLVYFLVPTGVCIDPVTLRCMDGTFPGGVWLEIALKACPGFLDVFFVLQSHAPCFFGLSAQLGFGMRRSWTTSPAAECARFKVLVFGRHQHLLWSLLDVQVTWPHLRLSASEFPGFSKLLAGISEDVFSAV